MAVYGCKYILKSPEEPLPDSQLIILGEMVQIGGIRGGNQDWEGGQRKLELYP